MQVDESFHRRVANRSGPSAESGASLPSVDSRIMRVGAFV